MIGRWCIDGKCRGKGWRLRQFSGLWLVVVAAVLAGCQQASKHCLLSGSRVDPAQGGVARNLRIEALVGSAVIYQPGSGYQRVRWQLAGNRARWQLELSDVMGFRLLSLAKLSSDSYCLKDKYGKLEADNLAALWQARRLSVAVSELLIDELWQYFEAKQGTDTAPVDQIGIVQQLSDGWQIVVVDLKWQPRLKSWHPSRLRLQRDRVAIQLLVDLTRLRVSETTERSKNDML